ncbi:hypothetical protein [Rufibacter roseus]|uniref:Lipoprotein n=1 Tax=Rufibacter roseus TaxID=1567108 RepID=A0ABW2DJQ0_9BACT|nr:hypothetical protein [Rufibacter roseus]
MKKTFQLLLAGLVLSLSACDDAPAPGGVKSEVQQAFDVNGLLAQEVDALAKQEVTVKKTVSKGGAAEETKTFKNLNWVEELAPFSDADLNKPALVGLFNVEETTNSARQTVRRYTAKEDADTYVEEAVYTFNPEGQLVQLDAIIRQDNVLFNTLKQLHLKFDPTAIPRLQRYRLDETQKLLFMDQEMYGVTGEIIK